MDHINSIIKGSEKYFRAFAMADNIVHNNGIIEWISPLPDTPGPSIVFRVELNEDNLQQQLEEIIPKVKSGIIPSFWVLTPNTTPNNLLEILETNGFKNLSDPNHPEFGMALDLMLLPVSTQHNPNILITKVSSPLEFEQWIDIVNKILHGSDLLSIARYGSWLACEDFSFYLAYQETEPIATVATFQDGKHASIEFVSTLEDYRKQGVATELCLTALYELQNKGVEIVTLRSSNEAINLYKNLGFKTYYEQILMLFQN